MVVSEEGKWPEEERWERYTSDKISRLLNTFPGVQNIKTNWSQSMQDMFVLTMHYGKRNGTYLEIGADQPRIINNTYLLESEFDWTGVSLEFDSDKVEFFNSVRKNKCICHDATTFDYVNLFEERNYPKQIDYLSLDIEPPEQTLKALSRMPHDVRFSVITFETDLYDTLRRNDGKSQVQSKSEEILLSYGYQRVVKNVASQGQPYEDWWIDPTVIDPHIVQKFVLSLCSYGHINYPYSNDMKIEGARCIIR